MSLKTLNATEEAIWEGISLLREVSDVIILIIFHSVRRISECDAQTMIRTN